MSTPSITKGFKFSTYATWWIRQAVARALADKGSSGVLGDLRRQIAKRADLRARKSVARLFQGKLAARGMEDAI